MKKLLKKLLKSDLFVFFVSWVLKFYVFLIFALRKPIIKIDKDAIALISDQNQPLIFCHWHSRILLLPKILSMLFAPHNRKSTAVVSSHKDGQYLTQFIKLYNHDAVRGSSRKNAQNAVRGVMSALKRNLCVIITPDGPIGPNMAVKGSAAAFAAKFNAPIITIYYAASCSKVLKTWDSFVVPFPVFSKIIIDVQKPIYFATKSAGNALLEKEMTDQVKRVDLEVQGAP